MQTETKKPLSVNIPFEGFYNSIWDSEIDSVLEMDAEGYAENDREENPKELHISADEFAGFLWECVDYSKLHNLMAHAICDAWNQVASENVDFELGLRFEEITSPRYYNFETDRLFATIPRATVARLFRMARADKFAKLSDIIRQRFTSCDGFISHYSNCLGDWLAKPVSQWDHNELGTLLIACVGDANEDLQVYYRAVDCDGFYHELCESYDYAKVKEKTEELRAEKLEELRKDEPDYVAPEPRCPFTLDLFEAR